MAPHTRSAAKHSPGRSTRNSVYGRPPPSPAKPRKSATNNTPTRTAQMHDKDVQAEVTSNGSNTKGIPWLACRDPHGVFTTVAVSETGEGVHIRWYYPEDDCEVDEHEGADVEMTVDEERAATPATTAGPSSAGRHPFPQTPMPLHPYDAGSVIQTPVKKAKPLQRSPPPIGDKGIRCLYETGGVLRELDGGVRLVLRHPVSSSANLSREQVEQLENEREDRIVQVQVEKLLEEKRRLQEEEEQFSDSSYENEMETDVTSSPRGLRREGTMVLVSYSELPHTIPSTSVEEVETALGFFRGPNGELLDQHGRQMLGREGTILLDTAHKSPRRIRREEAFLANELRRPRRLGREGTDLMD
ncbi:hypothetical protein V8E55_007127 [Tylopilus felleus]